MTDQKRSEGIGTRGADSILQTAKSVIPFLLSSKSSQNMVRIWIPECGNGLVAYFVASQFMNCVREKISEVHVRIFATDALETSIEIASQGAFDKDEACEVFGEKLGDCFYVEENRWHIKPDIRRCVIFATHQLYRDPPFERIDLIYASSRLLSDDMDKRSLSDVFTESLSNHGILMMEDRFEQYLNISGNSAFYRTDMPGVYQCRITNSVSDASYETGKKSEEMVTRKGQEAYIEHMEKFMPPSVLLNEFDEMIHVFGDLHSFLRSAPGKIHLHFPSLLIGNVSLVAHEAIRKARDEKVRVVYENVITRENNKEWKGEPIHLVVEPVCDEYGEYSQYLSVVFSLYAPIVEGEYRAIYSENKMVDHRIVVLEREKVMLQDRLDQLSDEIPQLKEDLSSQQKRYDEEMIKMQCANEKLLAIRDELYSVNAQYQEKVELLATELQELHRCFRSLEIGFVLTDTTGNMTTISDYCEKEFGLQGSDLGHSIQRWDTLFVEVPWIELVMDAVNHLSYYEGIVTSIKNQTYHLRVGPRKVTDNQVLGTAVMITRCIERQ